MSSDDDKRLRDARFLAGVGAGVVFAYAGRDSGEFAVDFSRVGVALGLGEAGIVGHTLYLYAVCLECGARLGRERPAFALGPRVPR